MSTVTMREMLEAGVHFGHQTRYWNPQMAPYLYGQRNKIHIINLETTLPLFNEAVNYIGKLASKKANILFVGTKRTAQKIIQEEAMRCGMYYINKRWLGGLLTNFKTVKQSINRLKTLEQMNEDGSVDRMSKKEALRHQRELTKLQINLSGIKDMPGIPDAMIVIDVGYENIAVSEAIKLGITVVGVVDSNNSPKGVDYVIPGNDDAIRSIRLYAKAMADAIIDGHGSVSLVIGEGSADDFVELDETGAPIIEDKKIKRKSKKITKKKVAKITVKPDAAEKSTGQAVADAEVKDEPQAAATVEIAKQEEVAEEKSTADASGTDDAVQEKSAIEPTEAEETVAEKPVKEPAEVDEATEEKTVKKVTGKKTTTAKKKTSKKKTARITAAKSDDSAAE